MPSTRRAAWGMTDNQILRRVELPLALPEILAGVRIAFTTTVGLATLAFFAGGGGLGEQIYSDEGRHRRHLLQVQRRRRRRARRPAGRGRRPDDPGVQRDRAAVAAGRCSLMALVLRARAGPQLGLRRRVRPDRLSERESISGGVCIGGPGEFLDLGGHAPGDRACSRSCSRSAIARAARALPRPHRARASSWPSRCPTSAARCPSLALLAFFVAFVGVGLRQRRARC